MARWDSSDIFVALVLHTCQDGFPGWVLSEWKDEIFKYCDCENFQVHLTDGSVTTPECSVMIPANEANEMDTVLLLGTVRDKVKPKKSFYRLSLEMEWETLSGRRRLRWWRSWSLPAWRESSWSPLASASHHRVIFVTLRRLWGWSMLECGMSTSLKRGPGECFFTITTYSGSPPGLCPPQPTRTTASTSSHPPLMLSGLPSVGASQGSRFWKINLTFRKFSGMELLLWLLNQQIYSQSTLLKQEQRSDYISPQKTSFSWNIWRLSWNNWALQTLAKHSGHLKVNLICRSSHKQTKTDQSPNMQQKPQNLPRMGTTTLTFALTWGRLCKMSFK